MAGFYKRQESGAAKWCLRFAVVTVPFLLLTIILRRNGAVTIEQSFWLLAASIALITASLVAGVKATLDLWDKGYKGGRAAVNGIVLAVLLLAPFGFQFLNAVENPRLNDVATDVVDPPPLDEGELSADSDAITAYDEYFARRIVASYPQLVGRRYEAPPERVLASVFQILDNWGWRRVGEANVPQLPDLVASDADDGNRESTVEEDGEQELAGSEDEVLQLQGAETGDDVIPDVLIIVEAHSMIMKLPSRLSIRLRDDNGSTLVDMRAASNWGPHDFGSNADNIAEFLAELDVLLSGLAGER